jgi:hypothetical protein
LAAAFGIPVVAVILVYLTTRSVRAYFGIGDAANNQH